tara:strand:+ start:876 stop:1520 length:645 start_codon:yes stop_codon:yes gene_type:complete
MEEEIEIINSNSRNEKIKNFFINFKNQIILLLALIILISFGYFFYQDYKSDKKIKLANQYNLAVLNYVPDEKNKTRIILEEIIKTKDKTYSPLAFYFLIDNEIINSKEEINNYFDFIINEISLDEEIQNLNIFKKGLFNSDFVNENELLDILNPIIKSQSIWRPHAIYLMAEYYFSNNQKQKSKEFFNKIISIENINPKIKVQAQKRLRADFSE